MKDELKVLFHRLTPKYLVTKAAGAFASKDFGSLTTNAIETFIKKYHIDMSEAAEENPAAYKTFNDFFSRSLKPEARPIESDPDAAVIPCDGTMSEEGNISYGRILAAKGVDYSLRAILGGSDQDAEAFKDGKFATIYLSPANYHRVHMPLTGRLKKMIYVPGKYYSVNPLYVKSIDNLYTKNERVISIFDTDYGQMAVIMVGATVVGSITTTWAGQITAVSGRSRKEFTYEADKAPIIKRGNEMGMFTMGSTVITIFSKGNTEFTKITEEKHKVKMGQMLAKVNLNQK